MHRDTRFGEKLATPDTSIADLIGEVDPIKVAEGRYLSDELTLHYGLVPRTNRGIFAINELPDLAERIQVGLLNVLEERDVQVRGLQDPPAARRDAGRVGQPRGLHEPRPHHHAVEGPLRRADPHALPARGRDRGGDREAGGAAARRSPASASSVPDFMTEIVATLSHLARQSPHINQRSGVSVRLTVSNSETLVANATRRALRHGENDVVPRVSDLEALASSTSGKVEIEAIEEGRDEQIVEHLLRSAVLTVFKERVGTEAVREVIGAFDGGTIVHAGDDVVSADEAEAGVRHPCAAPARRRPDRWRRVARGGGQRGRVHPRGTAPVQAPEQGRGRRPGDLPRPRLTARSRSPARRSSRGRCDRDRTSRSCTS